MIAGMHKIALPALLLLDRSTHYKNLSLGG